MGRVQKGCRDCRRQGEKLFLKGEKCTSAKCVILKRKNPPGQHGASITRPTEYARRLKEKQKARSIYDLSERQFRKYFEMASKSVGVTGQVLLELLELRLDNIVYRLGFSSSRTAARQLVLHGHATVNGKKVNIPSYSVKINDVIKLKEKAFQRAAEKLKDYTPPAWLALSESDGRVVRRPTREDTERLIQESLIVEYYSR